MTIRRLARPLALALPLALASTAAVLAAEPAAKTTAAAPADPAAPIEPNLGKVASDDAVELDVLAVVSLPIAADEAREAGVPPEEVAGVITAVVDVGASPAVATELLVAEAEQTRKRGAKANFAAWTRGQLAEGVPSEKLVTEIEKAEAQYIELAAAERAQLDAKITKLHDDAIVQRKAQWMKVSELRKQGKQLRVAGQEKLVELRKRVEASAARRKRIEDAKAADPKKKEVLDRLVAKVEKVVDQAVDKADAAVDKAEKAVDKAQDKADKAQDKADKAQDKADKAVEKPQ